MGGRARSYTGELPSERIFQVDFPERPGALRKFLAVFSPDFLITLFHYRETGALRSSACSSQNSAAASAGNCVPGRGGTSAEQQDT